MEVSVFDIECDGFNPTKIHVLSVFEKGQMRSTSNYKTMRRWFQNAECIVAHNCVRFDVPVLERLLGVKTNARIIDTLALSWTLFPSRMSHGLESWGEHYGVPKPKIDDWEGLSYEEYKHRCEEDVRINTLLWRDIEAYLKKLYKNKDDALRYIDYLTFKMDCARRQEQLKWKLNVHKAESLLEELQNESERRSEALKLAMPKVAITKTSKRPKALYKRSGEISVAGQKWLDLCNANGYDTNDSSLEEFEYVHEWVEGKPTSSQQIKAWLDGLGWKPETFEYKREEDGTVRKIPQVNVKGEGLCFSVKKLIPKCAGLAELEGLSIANHRLSIVKGFLNNVDENGYIVAAIAGLTNTLRFKHSILVNLPGVDKPYGKEIRGCLVAPKGYKLCGSDMSSLEDRTKQHYMWGYDPEYVKEMMTPDFDPHLDLAVFAGKLDSDRALWYKQDLLETGEKKLVAAIRKTFKGANYACVYGAQAPTVSRTAGIPVEEAESLVEAYWQRNWSVKAIAEDQTVKTVNGQMWLLNPVSGFYYSLRHKKDVFSTLNQGTGVYCFDTWVQFVREGRDEIVGQFHDEIILVVPEDETEDVVELLNSCIVKTNDKLKLNRELACSVDFGDSYADIH